MHGIVSEGWRVDRQNAVCKTAPGMAISDVIVAAKKQQRIDLEKAMAELEKIVTQLEGGDLSLEKSLQQFEKGVRLSRECQSALNEAEQKVQVLMDGEPRDTTAESLGSMTN